MSCAVVRYQTREDSADDNQLLVEKVFEQLTETDPGNLHYAVFRLADGVTFVHVVVTDGPGSPLPELSAFQEFSGGVADRCDEPPSPAEATLVGAYRFLTA